MRTFEVAARGQSEHHGHHASSVSGFRAAGAMVMLVEDGDGWLTDQSGERVPVSAPHVAAYDAGDWVEYGSDGPLRIRNYWGPREHEVGFHPSGPADAPPGEPPAS